MTSVPFTFPPGTVFLDFETTNLESGWAVNPDNRIVLACWKRDGVRHHSWGDEFHQPALADAVMSAPMIVAHSAQFECGWLRRMGVDMSKLPTVFDTLLAQKVIASNRPWPLSLDMVAQHYRLGHKDSLVSKLIRSGVCPSGIPRSLLLRYGTQDVDLLERLAEALAAVMTREQLRLHRTRCELVPVLSDIEFNGMVPDKVRVTALHQELSTKLLMLEGEIETLAPGVNWNSPMQVATLLYETWGIKELTDTHGNPVRTETGRPKADEATISRLKGVNAKSKKFLELKKQATQVSSALSKSINSLKECIGNNDRLHAHLTQHRTKTDRTSSQGGKYSIQFQNMDRDFKKLFTAGEGMVVVDADASQLEFRVAADLGRDAVAVADIRSGRDVHKWTAEILTSAGQPTTRQEAKPHTFKPLYGGMSGTDAERTYYDAFKARYAGIAGTQAAWAKSVLKDGQLRMPWGVTYYWPGTRTTSSGYIENTSQIYNYPVQALATAEIMRLVVLGVWKDLKKSGMRTRIINLVHDSVVLEAVPDELDAVREILVRNFTKDCVARLYKRYGYRFTVPLGCSIKTGDHWGEGDEVKYEVNDDANI